jgi:hypothetical protein
VYFILASNVEPVVDSFVSNDGVTVPPPTLLGDSNVNVLDAFGCLDGVGDFDENTSNRRADIPLTGLYLLW